MIITLIVYLSPIIICYFIGSSVERSHYKRIKERELKFLDLPALNIKKIQIERKIKRVELVTGSAVISLDYFKRVMASLRFIIGGRVKVYESLLDRARREALLRMKESCGEGAGLIINVRFENSAIGSSANNKNQIGCLEALAYGTAIYFEDDNQ